MKRTVNGNEWNYCDSEGFWWLQDAGKDTRTSIRRSDRNQNIWLVCDGEQVLDEFSSMRKAMESI